MNVYNDSSDESTDNDNINNKTLYEEFEQFIRKPKENFKP